MFNNCSSSTIVMFNNCSSAVKSGNRAHKSGNRDDQEKFKQLRNKVVAKLRAAKKEFFSNIHPQNPKEFWKLVKSVKPRNNEFPTLKLGPVVASTDVEKAHLLNDVFINSFNHATPCST